MNPHLEETLQSLPHAPGVYIFRDSEKKPLYIGKSVDLRARVKSYFQNDIALPPKTRQLVQHIFSVETIETGSEIEALLLEAALIQSIHPVYNTALKDDKRYVYIQITQSYYARMAERLNVRTKGRRRKVHHPPHAYPQIMTARNAKDPQSLYFGPFPDAKTVKIVLKQLRRTFGWCKYSTLEAVERSRKPCFYYHIGQCPGYCAQKIELTEYYEHIDRIIQFLRGDKAELIENLTKRMTEAAVDEDFEQAALMRDQLKRLEYITQSFKSPDVFFSSPVLEDEQYYFARQQLRDVIGEINQTWAPWLRSLERIEAYDISNVQGEHATGSMVVLINGKPSTDVYRRFKIKTVHGANDPAMMWEVLERRLRYLDQEKTGKDESFNALPQLLVIDGGKTQVGAVRAVLERHSMDIPVIGLAKREETLIIPVKDTRRFVEVKLPHDSPALHLMQKIRDEAHRFAKRYHVVLRDKQIYLPAQAGK